MRKILIIAVLLLSPCAMGAYGGYMGVSWNHTARRVISGLSVTDLDGDGYLETAFGASDSGFLTILDADGGVRWEKDLRSYVFTVTAAEGGFAAGTAGRVYQFDSGGEVWHYSTQKHHVRQLLSADVDGDSIKELVLATYTVDTKGGKCVDGLIIILNASGSRLSTHNTGYALPVHVLTADLNDDVGDEIIVGTVYRAKDTGRRRCSLSYMGPGTVNVLSGNGSILWEYTLPTGVSSLASGDLDGDGMPEIVVGTQNEIYAFDYNGQMLWNRSMLSRVDVLDVADVVGDGVKEVVAGSENLYLIDFEGFLIWEAMTTDRVYSLTHADLNGDGSYELIAGSDTVYVFHPNGSTAYVGPPLLSVGDLFVSDINNDGYVDVIAGAVKQVVVFETAFPGKIQQGEAYLNLARDYLDKGDNENALKYALRAKTVFFDLGDLTQMSEAMRLIDSIGDVNITETVNETENISAETLTTTSPTPNTTSRNILNITAPKINLSRGIDSLKEKACGVFEVVERMRAKLTLERVLRYQREIMYLLLAVFILLLLLVVLFVLGKTLKYVARKRRKKHEKKRKKPLDEPEPADEDSPKEAEAEETPPPQEEVESITEDLEPRPLPEKMFKSSKRHTGKTIFRCGKKHHKK